MCSFPSPCPNPAVATGCLETAVLVPISLLTLQTCCEGPGRNGAGNGCVALIFPWGSGGGRGATSHMWSRTSRGRWSFCLQGALTLCLPDNSQACQVIFSQEAGEARRTALVRMSTGRMFAVVGDNSWQRLSGRGGTVQGHIACFTVMFAPYKLTI